MKLIIFILHQIMCSFWLQLVHSCYRKLVHCKLPITWDAFRSSYNDKLLVEGLDIEGTKIAQLMQVELGGKVWYYSDATQQSKTI